MNSNGHHCFLVCHCLHCFALVSAGKAAESEVLMKTVCHALAPTLNSCLAFKVPFWVSVKHGCTVSTKHIFMVSFLVLFQKHTHSGFAQVFSLLSLSPLFDFHWITDGSIDDELALAVHFLATAMSCTCDISGASDHIAASSPCLKAPMLDLRDR